MCMKYIIQNGYSDMFVSLLHNYINYITMYLF